MHDDRLRCLWRWKKMFAQAALAVALCCPVAAEMNGGMPPVDSEEFAGMAEVAITEACASACHGFDVIFGGPRRMPLEWDTVIEDMVGQGAMVSDEQMSIIKRYLKWAWGSLWINRATSDDLVAVLAIPIEDAEAIIGWREANGPFDDIPSLKAVPGIDADAIDAQAGAILFD